MGREVGQVQILQERGIPISLIHPRSCYASTMSPAPVRIVGVSVPLQDLLVLAFTSAVAATVACAVCGAVAVAVVVAVSVI